MKKSETKQENFEAGWTEIICVLDRSGSMAGLEEDTIGGLNAFIEDQANQEGDARVSLILFDHDYDVVWKNRDVKSKPTLDASVYHVRGSTALLDAVGRSVVGAKKRFDKMHPDERPGEVIVVIATDGYENASTRYSETQVNKLVSDRQEDGWTFVFLGAGIDAITVARNIGIQEGHASSVSKSAQGQRELYSKISRAASRKRRGLDAKGVDDDLLDDEWI